MRRFLLRRKTPGGGLVILLAAVASLFALSASPAGAAVSPAPGGMHLRGSNGYLIDVIAQPAGFGSASQLVLTASRNGSSTSYVAPAKITPTSFAADFGALGKVSVAWHPTGGITDFVGCSGEELSYEAGYYEGTIEFHGEEDFTEVATSWAFGRPPAFCGSLSLIISGGEANGALLDVASLKKKRQFFFQAYRNKPQQPTHFRADLLEANGDTAIVRSVQVQGGAKTLRYGPHPKDPVVVRPPAPFAGTGIFHPKQPRRDRWTGNLRADFPGKANANLTGPVTFGTFNRHTMVITSP